MTTPPPALLIVDDDAEIRRLVVELFQAEGFEMAAAADGVEMDRALARQRPDLVLLDLMMPGEDGLALCRRLRSAADPIPIIMLTAKSDAIDRIVGLEVGADDYLPKPFAPRELLARARAVLRRSAGQAAAVPAANRRFKFDAFILDLDARQVTDVNGGEITLTGGEFDILACLVQRPRRVLSRDQILDWTRGRVADPFDRTVDMQISRLRRKLGAVSPDQKLISTIRNGGYLLTATVEVLT